MNNPPQARSVVRWSWGGSAAAGLSTLLVVLAASQGGGTGFATVLIAAWATAVVLGMASIRKARPGVTPFDPAPTERSLRRLLIAAGIASVLPWPVILFVGSEINLATFDLTGGVLAPLCFLMALRNLEPESRVEGIGQIQSVIPCTAIRGKSRLEAWRREVGIDDLVGGLLDGVVAIVTQTAVSAHSNRSHYTPVDVFIGESGLAIRRTDDLLRKIWANLILAADFPAAQMLWSDIRSVEGHRGLRASLRFSVANAQVSDFVLIARNRKLASLEETLRAHGIGVT